VCKCRSIRSAAASVSGSGGAAAAVRSRAGMLGGSAKWSFPSRLRSRRKTTSCQQSSRARREQARDGHGANSHVPASFSAVCFSLRSFRTAPVTLFNRPRLPQHVQDRSRSSLPKAATNASRNSASCHRLEGEGRRLKRANGLGIGMAVIVELAAMRHSSIDSCINGPIVADKRMTAWPRRMPDFKRIATPV
jgi:hypothetical protein